MGLIRRTMAAIGRTDMEADEDAEEEPAEEPSHVCTTCGEEYFTNPSVEIDTCRSCGGVKIEAVAG